MEEPKDFICPITKKLMFDPVIHAGGNIYEKKVLVDWFKDHDTSPTSKNKLEHKFLIP